VEISHGTSFPIREKPMKPRSEITRTALTAYESEQVRRIAAWKSKPPNPVSEMWKRLILPGARLVEKIIPDTLVLAAIEESYDIAERLAGQEDVQRRAGIKDLRELRDRPLEECDRLAMQVGPAAQTLAVVEGAATGAGGVLTTLVDIPLLFVLSLRTILKIGHCYGYPLDHHRGRQFVLGVLLAALSGSLETKRHRLDRLHQLEELLIVETQEEIITEELLSFLFQLEIFEEVPGVGALSGALLNLAFMHRVDVTAQRVFEERWLRDNGKVGVIAPAPAAARHLATGWSGALGRVVYSGCYGLGFGVALPVFAVAALFRAGEIERTRAVGDGTTTAREGAPALATP
jgi:EcsC protein family